MVESPFTAVRLPRRGEERALNQEGLVVGVDAALAAPAKLRHLRGIDPLVERGGGVHALVALEPDEVAAEYLRERLARLGLAGSGRSLEQQGLAEREGEKGGGAHVLVRNATPRGRVRCSGCLGLGLA